MTVDISIIIPTMNRPESLEKTLDCIANCSIIPSEIIVVDQSQNPQIIVKNQEILNSISYLTNIKYLYLKIPSLTSARNYGIRNATNEIIVCSDDDVDVKKDTFKLIYDIMQNRSIAMIAGLDTKTPLSGGNMLGYLFGTKSFLKRKKGHVTKSMLGRFPVSVDVIVDTEWAMGFFLLLEKACMKNGIYGGMSN